MTKSVHKKNYLEVSYDPKKLPLTDYPMQLASHLAQRFFDSGEGKSILDVGCGRGEFLKAFSHPNVGLKALGIDVSPLVHDLESEFLVHQCDLEKDSFPHQDSSVDYIFSKSVVEHLRCPEKMVDESFRVLKSGGRAIFMCPSWIHTYWGPFYIDHTHVTPFTLPSLSQLLELSGFKVICSEHFVQLPVLWKYPFLGGFSELTALLPIPFRPLYNSSLPESVNKWVRFSKEKMLLVVGEKS